MTARPLELRDQGLGRRWLDAGSTLARTTPSFDAPMVGVLLSAAITEADGLPPPGVVLDLATLLHGGRLAPRAPTPPDAGLARALAVYEHQVLGRLAAEGRMTMAADAVARLPPSLRPVAVGVTLATIMARLRPADAVLLPPGVARRFGQLAVGDDPFETLRDDDEVRGILCRGYEGLVAAAQRARSLLGEGDVFTLEHLAILESLAQRIALEDVLGAEAMLLDGVPRRLRRRQRPRGVVSARLEEEDTYPVGGFSALSTLGSFENLVTSELAYLDDGGEIDLFDVRFAQGELLYYTRDEATLLRTHRFLSFVFEPALVAARCKDPGVSFQRIVLLLATVHALVVRLCDELGEEELTVRLAFPPFGELAAERSLSGVLFHEQIERGVVEIVAATIGDETARAADAAGRGIAQLVRCAPEETQMEHPRAVEVFALPAARSTLKDARTLLLTLLSALP